MLRDLRVAPAAQPCQDIIHCHPHLKACAVSFDDVQLLADATHPNPKHVLGVQAVGSGLVWLVWMLGAMPVAVLVPLVFR